MASTPPQTVELDLRALTPCQLRAHPLNSNRMSDRLRAKLREQILRFGRYEPLIVRPHPDERDAFEVLNGHHRLLVLRELGYETARN